MTDSRAFDWDYKSDYTVGFNTNPPRFEAGETYEFSLRRSNTGFHAIWHRDGQVEEVIHYDPDLLLTQNGEPHLRRTLRGPRHCGHGDGLVLPDPPPR